jgi:diacylglycerol kinase family enzyme
MGSASGAGRTPAAGERIAAFLSLATVAATIVIAAVGLIRSPLDIAISFVAAGVLSFGAVMFVTCTGVPRWSGATLIVVGVLGWIWVVVTGDALRYIVTLLATDLLATVFTLWALRPRPYRPPARDVRPPEKPFILMNPKSGGGKVAKFDLERRARSLGAEVARLEPGVDVVATLEQAARDGADLLGAAGGDGTQALVAQVAVEHGLPVLCIPAGTRNHFALDLGLDRDDPSVTLDALGEEGEEIGIDLGDVGGRPFVNNVSLGAYAEIVARGEYRDAKVQTTLATLPELTRPGARSGLSVEAEGRDPVVDPQLVQVANNPYARPEDTTRMGTRPRLDTGTLGVEVIAYQNSRELRGLIGNVSINALDRAKAYRSWTGRSLTVTSQDGTVRAGVDGEYVEFPSPLEISIQPGVLRVRVPRDRPGKKAVWPRFDSRMVTRMWSIVRGDSGK